MKKATALFISILFVSAVFAQQTQSANPSCENQIFDQAVRKALSFSIPVMDVSDLNKALDDVIILDAREKEEYEKVRRKTNFKIRIYGIY